MSLTGRFSTAALCVLLLAPAGAQAQGLARSSGTYEIPPDSMPAWTVPVLRLVSATHVEPTTGVIISDSGLVLVPEAFADESDEIIVLDGGTDIIRNGRPARIERTFQAVGLQVLSVEGLNRRGATLAAESPGDGGRVTLYAFPPAEQIAQGEPPVNQSATVTVFGENQRPSIAGETPLPNVTGALTDACGNLVAVSLADGVQTMAPAATGYRWKDILSQVLEALQVTPREALCVDETAARQEDTPPEEEPAPEIEEVPAPEPAAEEPAPEEPSEPEPGEETLPEPPEEEAAPPGIDVLPPIEKDTPADLTDSDEPGPSAWWWLGGAILLTGAGLALHRWRRSLRQDTPDPGGDAETTQRIEIEGEETEGIPEAEPALDAVLTLHGVLGDGTEIECSCPVSRRAINLVIGRGGADLVIDSPAVSRRHAVLNGSQAELTISDLGSSNGTSINGVPCMEDEILFVEPGDSVVLGDVRIRIEIGPRGNGGE